MAFVDPYIDKNTGLLRNLIGATTSEDLEEREAQIVFAELAKENNLKGLDRSVFVERLSHHYDQLNFIHPFREGNGRAQRVFGLA